MTIKRPLILQLVRKQQSSLRRSSRESILYSVAVGQNISGGVRDALCSAEKAMLDLACVVLNGCDPQDCPQVPQFAK